ncbi:hypothetical protein PSMK_16640 [Phycisphaera mikurensis NBRC 102666]|uniref:Uncharacterized protein n=1 Tax=Phycisphaera mikurensis (strain NBRC 102666 / KCTC 22515 / FYK2301M01) TaxID=1142394 RepID=I0IEY5_PHYMF|nr:hypothetical protein PSMK_16640 [Phycisphaera mikurensis NBRC 102666]
MDLKSELNKQPFQPIQVVLSSGDRHPIRHPEFAIFTDYNSVYVFDSDKSPQEEPHPDTRGPVILSISQIVAVEPLSQTAA